MYLLLFFFFLVSCSEDVSHYFPLDKIKSWSYSIEIIPEVENKAIYKKTNLSMGKKKSLLVKKASLCSQYFVRMELHFIMNFLMMVYTE